MRPLYWHTYISGPGMTPEDTRLQVTEAFASYVAAHVNKFSWQGSMIPKADRFETCVPFRRPKDIENVAQNLAFAAPYMKRAS